MASRSVSVKRVWNVDVVFRFTHFHWEIGPTYDMIFAVIDVVPSITRRRLRFATFLKSVSLVENE